jgi:hypothetical protein
MGRDLLQKFMQEETDCHISWYIPVIPALGKLKKKKQEFEANLGYIGWFYLKKKKEHVRMYAMHKTTNKYVIMEGATWPLICA